MMQTEHDVDQGELGKSTNGQSANTRASTALANKRSLMLDKVALILVPMIFVSISLLYWISYLSR